MAEVIQVEARKIRGKHNARRLRRVGKVPAILYGHGEETIALEAEAVVVEHAVNHGSRVVTLTGAVDETAFIRDMQWDVWSKHIQHVDFTRVSQSEKVEVNLAVELRGVSPGVKEGGVVEQLLHEIHIKCPVASLPEKIIVNINNLKLDGAIKVCDLELPEGSELLGDPEEMVVHCITPMAMPEEEEAAAAEEGEPEVIGRKEEETGESGSE